MLDEISAAVIFLVRLIEKSENFNQEQLEDFKARLSELLVERFENHWFPDQPCKGQGYRCIRVNERDRDATLERAAVACGLKYEDLKLPVELTIWVDPNEVCCSAPRLCSVCKSCKHKHESLEFANFHVNVLRFGEHRGSYCTLASFSDKENITTIDKQLEKIDEIESKLQCFDDDKELKTSVVGWLQSQAAEFYDCGISKLIKRYDKCLNVTGNYVEK
ncbi:hypothetical protein ANN_18682 [Periplaneta americana]|uniref:Anti-proliferative protein domain-containing protein n=1 Tax=Periplaneta americana TaxID=6978 RepID=A0ABQ8SQQ7_PERAM|nr:hypothetical protein ANN_18682 [Periplaneta americana]